MTPILDTALIKHHRVDYGAMPPWGARLSRRAVGVLAVVFMAFAVVGAVVA